MKLLRINWSLFSLVNKAALFMQVQAAIFNSTETECTVHS